jgi:thiamine transporter
MKGRRKKMNTKNTILRLTESAVMLALATVLSNITLLQMPMGGSVTALSMAPILIIAYRHGTRHGLLTGAVYGLMQLMLGMHNLKYGTSLWAVLVILLFDYLVAFMVLGFGGLFRKSCRNQAAALVLGAGLASLLRFGCHFISGWVVWGVWAPEGMPAWLYSISYNAYYMVPEAVLTMVGLVLLSVYLDFTSENITRRAAKPAALPRNITAQTCKLAGISVACTGIFFLLGEALTVLTTEGAEMDKLHCLTVLAVLLIVGAVVYALGEIVQLLSDIKHKNAQ